MHAISSYRGNRPTNKHTHKQITIQCAAKLSMQCNNFHVLELQLSPVVPFSASTLLLGWQEGRPACENAGCWFVVGDDLTGALHVLWLQLLPPLPSSLAPMRSRMETFWYQLAQVHLEKWPLNRREREKSGCHHCCSHCISCSKTKKCLTFSNQLTHFVPKTGHYTRLVEVV